MLGPDWVPLVTWDTGTQRAASSSSGRWSTNTCSREGSPPLHIVIGAQYSCQSWGSCPAIEVGAHLNGAVPEGGVPAEILPLLNVLVGDLWCKEEQLNGSKTW